MEFDKYINKLFIENMWHGKTKCNKVIPTNKENYKAKKCNRPKGHSGPCYTYPKDGKSLDQS